jgi:hypothetical protein
MSSPPKRISERRWNFFSWWKIICLETGRFEAFVSSNGTSEQRRVMKHFRLALIPGFFDGAWQLGAKHRIVAGIQQRAVSAIEQCYADAGPPPLAPWKMAEPIVLLVCAIPIAQLGKK